MSAQPPQRDYDLAVVIADILATRIRLLPANPVLLYNQKFRIPPNDDLFLYVAFLFDKPYGNQPNRAVDDPTNPNAMVEQSLIQTQETYQIEAYSKGPAARVRRFEILSALASIYAQQQAEKYCFKIGTVPTSMVDLSSGEGAARLNRYAVTISFLRGYLTQTPIECYTVFQNPPKQILTDPQKSENALQNA